MNRETKELLFNPPDVKKLLPYYFRKTIPMKDITDTEDVEFSRFSLELMKTYRNTSLNTADDATLGMYEFLYGINAPAPTDLSKIKPIKDDGVIPKREYRVYADSITGSGMSKDSTGKAYVGQLIEDDIFSLYGKGENLLDGGAVERVGTEEYFEIPIDLTPILEVGKEYTITFEIKGSIDGHILIYSSNSAQKYKINEYVLENTTEYQRFGFTFTPQNGNSQHTETKIALYNIYTTGNKPSIRNIQIEKGNVIRQFKPSYNDILQSIAAVPYGDRNINDGYDLPNRNLINTYNHQDTKKFNMHANNTEFGITTQDVGTHKRMRREFVEPCEYRHSLYTNVFFNTEAGLDYVVSLSVKPERYVGLYMDSPLQKHYYCPANEWTRMEVGLPQSWGRLTHPMRFSGLYSISGIGPEITPEYNPWIEYTGAKAEIGIVSTPYTQPPEELINYLTDASNYVWSAIEQPNEYRLIRDVKQEDLDVVALNTKVANNMFSNGGFYNLVGISKEDIEFVNSSGIISGGFVFVDDNTVVYFTDVDLFIERRARLANRVSTRPPFTRKFLVNKLNELLGEENYSLTIDYQNSVIQVESTNLSQSWAEEVYITINNIKPASMIYLNIPVDLNEVIVEEGVSLSQFIYNYRLGTQWVLGRKAFVSFEDLGEVKSMAINSFTPFAHNRTANFLVTQVAKVRLNGDNTKMITAFVSKQTENNIGEVVYEVPQGFVTAVSKVDLMDSANNILSTSNFYVPIPDTTQIKHRFRVRNVS